MEPLSKFQKQQLAFDRARDQLFIQGEAMLDFIFKREVKLYKEVVYGCARQWEEDERAVTKGLPKHRRELLSKGYGDEYTAAIVNQATKEVMQELRDRTKVLRAMIAESKREIDSRSKSETLNPLL